MTRLDPRSRILLALLFALTVILTHSLAGLVVDLGIAMILTLLARMPPRQTLRRILALEGFMLAVLLLLPFTVPGETIAQPLGLAISAEGLTQAALIALRGSAVALAMMALIGTLESVALGHALARLGAPERLIHLFLFTIRYLDVLEREYRRLRLAMRARAFQTRAGLHCWRSVGYLFGMLMVRSLERAERIDSAMRCRGFGGRFPSLNDAEDQRPGILDWGLGAASCIALVLVGA